MERLPSMKKMETVSKEWTIQKMRRSKSLHRLHSILLAKLQSLETSIDSMSTITIQRDLNGMKSAASRLKTITQSQLLLGNRIHQRLGSDPYVDQSMSSMFVSKRLSIKESLNSHMFL